ncbi:MAG: U32 family peptidase, partial [Elusimicrobia bacterium]|nr:U32 family peptidase [Elusimicrobiota bacterium]
MDKTFELLAPAKDLACGLAALECGADAVYVGAERFGARAAAANQLPDVARLIRRAHLFRAKVYAAVNTILRDEELEPARRLIVRLWEEGADAVIIQDLGLLELDLPPVPLIASTQMHNSGAERVRFLRDAGFQRAILARELTLAEVRAIADEAPGIELECFVHGALCVCYSGRCYL